MDSQYEPKKFEKKIYENWKQSGYFNANVNSKKKPFTIMIPPPNVTGSLHMGHALNNTVIDILIRQKRMQGYESLYQPGTDHAGIATQNKVEQKLAEEGKTRFDLGRKKFDEEIWKWKDQYENHILGQLETLGCSCDWTKTRFTMDKDYSKAVNEAFIHYYKKGLIYKGTRVVNWCIRCGTSISDIEVDYKKQKAKLYYFKYDKNFPITIATTRPETKLGDTGVAVNPKDKRYKKYIGKIFDIDFCGIKRKVKVISDSAVDTEFGTGAVGVTPAHSLIDEKMAEKNGLEKIQVINEKGEIINSGEYNDLNVYKARKLIIECLEKNGLMEKIEEIDNNLSICSRCNSPIEPLLSSQWFLKMKKLAKPAIDVVKKGDIKFTPKRWEKVYLDWLENIEDWCISRQLWWGHRLPVWQSKSKIKNLSRIGLRDQKSKLNSNFKTCAELDSVLKISNSSNFYIGENPPKNYVQSSDVLDTWFSSALWPFATLGWPYSDCHSRENGNLYNRSRINVRDDKCDLDYFYPTNILSTARDIIFLWVARMVFSSLEFTGKIPFERVYIHPTVFNKEGKRMSKSLGTGVDPIELIEKYGADATRFGLMYQNTGIQDIRFSEEAIFAGKKFANKIWNAGRFVMMQIDEDFICHLEEERREISSNLNKNDQKILDKLDQLIKTYNLDLDKFKFGKITHDIYEYFWHDFCDKTIEDCKKRIYNPKNEADKYSAQYTLFTILKTNLQLLHPIMPFVTESIWQELRKIDASLEKSIMISAWPK